MNKNLYIIMECARAFSLPMTIFSWLIIFTYAVINSGNVVYGIIALVGICFAHLGANLLDDFLDYKLLIKQVNFDKDEYLKNSQKTKCRYLINGIIEEKQLLIITGVFFLIALMTGLFLFIKCGMVVAYCTLIAAVLIVLYPFLSRICLSEVVIALIYGPLLFSGVYYVMTGSVSADIFLLSIPTMFITVVLLYIHTIMDYDYDIGENKATIANRFNSRLDSLIILKVLLILAYISLIFLAIFDILDWQVFLVFLTIPLAKDLYDSLIGFASNPEIMPKRKWYHFPMENLNLFEKRNEGSFMMRMFQSRNLMIYFSLLFMISILLSLAL